MSHSGIVVEILIIIKRIKLLYIYLKQNQSDEKSFKKHRIKFS
jgi:hypothetical protein